jgi:putative tryptophan/tyrosine transport system substrate-binding protein
MRRIGLAVVLAVGLVLASFAAEGQTGGKVYRIGYLATDLAAASSTTEAFRRGLRDLGYVEGRNVVIEYRDAEGKSERLPALAAELATLKADVIVTAGGTLAALAAKRATKTVPIVFIAVSDPVASAVVTSLAHPGGNVTGLSNFNAELVGKRLEHIVQAVPGLSRVVALWQPGGLGERTEREMLKQADDAARSLGVRLQFVEAREAADLERAFSEISRARPHALTLFPSTMFFNERSHITDLAAKTRVPAMYQLREFVEAGGLMSYGTNLADLFQRAATYVDKIFKREAG